MSEAPAAPPAIRTIDDLRVHLQAAVELEHTTIPPYLTARYTLRAGANVEAARILKSVAREEMLHMALAANVLNAVDGAPVIADPKFVPVYPVKLPVGQGQPIEVGIRAFSKATLATFLQIESPKRPPAVKTAALLAAVPVAPGQLAEALRKGELYASIGDFYEAIEDGLKALEAAAKTAGGTIFTGDPARQVTTNYYGGGGKLIKVIDLDTALQALKEIVDQGEGYGDTIEEGADVTSVSELKVAHYYRFRQIADEHLYQDGDKADDPPSGAALAVDWSAAAVFPMVDDPAPEMYADPALKQASTNFTAMYSELLRELHRAFNGEPGRMDPAVVAMMELPNLATILLNNPIAGQATVAGPCFRYVPV